MCVYFTANRPSMDLAIALHPQLEPLSFMLGTWRGQGEGGFPTISAFQYGEEIRFWHSGKPVMAYMQKTWKLASGEPMHAESGYWKPKPDGSVEVVIAQSTGLAEVQKGRFDVDKKTISLESETVSNASKVKEIMRSFKVNNDELEYTVSMGTNTQSLQPHLHAVLKKVNS